MERFKTFSERGATISKRSIIGYSETEFLPTGERRRVPAEDQRASAFWGQKSSRLVNLNINGMLPTLAGSAMYRLLTRYNSDRKVTSLGFTVAGLRN